MRTQTVTITCDFCGYGGQWTRPEDFTHVAAESIDLCRWCSRPSTPPSGSVLECGRHLVTFTDTGWWCSCGQSFVDTGDVSVKGWPYFVPSRLRRAVPSISFATANVHTQGL